MGSKWAVKSGFLATSDGVGRAVFLVVTPSQCLTEEHSSPLTGFHAQCGVDNEQVKHGLEPRAFIMLFRTLLVRVQREALAFRLLPCTWQLVVALLQSVAIPRFRVVQPYHHYK